MGSSLKRGLVKSCGCYSKKVNSEIHKKYNQYEIYNNEYAVVYFTNSKKYFICDIEDINIIKQYAWRLAQNNTVITTVCKDDKQSTLYVYNVIMNPKNNEVVDHINGNRLDNRKFNLRRCTQLQNSYNQKIRKDNKSGHKGVYWDKSRNKWSSQITAETITHFLGRFDVYDDAVCAYEDAETKYFGKYGTKASRNGYS